MKKKFSRLITCLLAFSILFTSFSSTVFAAKTSIIKPKKSYEIDVVFDNSGSMYGDTGSQSWCRAKYAMEIFGSMLDYDSGDVMKIFPMWYVSTTKTVSNKSAAVEPVIISSINDIDKISYMYTPCSDGGVDTPFEPVEEAYRSLKSSDKTEKWLVVLTDGIFNKDTRNQKEATDFTKDKLKKSLTSKTTNGIHVQYIAIGEDISAEADLSEFTDNDKFYADLAKNTEELTDKMISICNRIFQRHQLPDKYISNKSIKLEVSMSSLIIFVAGKDAKVSSFKDSSGKEIAPTTNSGVRKCSSLSYSHGKANKSSFYTTKTDDSLYGQVVTFSDCPAGEYSISYSGKIQVFYDPNIRIDIKVASDDDGYDVIDPNSDGDVKTLEEGEYYVFYELADNITGESVTDSSLVKSEGLSGKVKITDESGKETSVNLESSGSEISLVEGETIYFLVEGKYLDGYEIKTSDNAQEYTFRVVHPTTLKIKAKLEEDYFQTGKEKDWAPIVISTTLAGEKVPAKIFEKCKLDISFDKKISYKIDKDSDNSCFYVHLGVNDKGEPVSPEIGDYKFNCNVSCTDDNEKINPSKSTSDEFEVSNYPFWYRIAFSILLLLLILAIILFIMSRKAMPKDIALARDSTEFKVGARPVNGVSSRVTYNKKSRRLEVKTPDYDLNQFATGKMIFTLKPIDKRWTKSKNRRVTIVGVSSLGAVEECDVSGVTYEKINGKWIDSATIDAPKPINQNIRNASINMSMKNGRRSVSDLYCELRHK